MFSAFSLPFSIPSLGWSRRKGNGPANLASVPIHNTETDDDKRSKRLRSLLKLNHANHSVIYNNLRFHNHIPHILSSAFILGASPEQLTYIYEAESESKEPWPDSPDEISKDDWREYFGNKHYQRAYVNFFEDELVSYGYDWKKLLEHYLYAGPNPLITSLVSGLGHPLIHLGYAYEINSRHVAIEALALGTCFYDSLHKYIDDPSYTKPSSYSTTSVVEIADRVRNDSRLDGLLDHIGADNFSTILAEKEDVLLEHWNAWDVSAATLHACFRQAQLAAVALVVATPDHPPKPPPRAAAAASPTTQTQAQTHMHKYYDFFLLHGLTTSHALRILLPLVPAAHHVPLARAWLLFALLAYISQRRPRVDLARITSYPLEREGDGDAAGADASWAYVRRVALAGPHRADAHFVKGLRACWVAEDTWGADPAAGADVLPAYWRRAAVRLADEFVGWGGFDAKTEGYQAH